MRPPHPWWHLRHIWKQIDKPSSERRRTVDRGPFKINGHRWPTIGICTVRQCRRGERVVGQVLMRNLFIVFKIKQQSLSNFGLWMWYGCRCRCRCPLQTCTNSNCTALLEGMIPSGLFYFSLSCQLVPFINNNSLKWFFEWSTKWKIII